ncbi:MAG: STAS/SEC14 domain-containing protein [Pseudomonadota bacterium]
MATTETSYSTRLLEEHCEVHFSCSGFWKLEGMLELLEQLNDTVLPLVKARKPIYALGDYEGFVPQDKDTADAIQAHLKNAVKFGLKRIAIVQASPLMKLQYKRLSKGLDVDFFDTKTAAIAWLRSAE